MAMDPLDIRDARRCAEERRYLCRLESLEKKAEPMIGELCREGRAVYYCYPVGGKYFESPYRLDVANYLIRNRYVRLTKRDKQHAERS